MIRRFVRPYAKAMMELSGTPEAAKATHQKIAAFEAAASQSGELRQLFENPGVDVESKLKVVRQMASRLEIDPLGLRLLEVLVRHHRINDLGAVLEGWKEKINEGLGIAVAEVRTAHSIDAAERTRLSEALQARLGRQVELDVTTDPALLGGFVAKVESEVWDASVRGKLNKLRSSLS